MDAARMHRWGAITVTWVQKTAALLLEARDAAANDEARWLVAYETRRLLERTLAEAEGLVRLLDADEELARDVEEQATLLVAALRRQRLAAKLANVEGRTPEEAETFRRKAAELTGDSRQTG